ncbi:MAG TPA: aminotransferase class V-fold PLP-dependent enzyme, partial [Acidimicrobiia bacterium]
WVGFGAACAVVDIAAETASQRALVERASAVVDIVADVERLGDGSLPNVLCLGVGGVEAEPILLALDQHGVAVHSGSACSSETLEPSPVLEAMGVDADRSLRISVGWSSTIADVDRFVEVFPGIVERLRGLRSV